MAPAAVTDNGARWMISGRPPKKTGETLQAVQSGDITITFKEIPGWKKPDDLAKTLGDGQTLHVTDDEATYTQLPIEGFEARGYSKTQVRIGRSTCNGTPPAGFSIDDEANPSLVTETSGVFWIKTEVEEHYTLTGIVTIDSKGAATKTTRTAGGEVKYKHTGTEVFAGSCTPTSFPARTSTQSISLESNASEVSGFDGGLPFELSPAGTANFEDGGSASSTSPDEQAVTLPPPNWTGSRVDTLEDEYTTDDLLTKLAARVADDSWHNPSFTLGEDAGSSFFLATDERSACKNADLRFSSCHASRLRKPFG